MFIFVVADIIISNIFIAGPAIAIRIFFISSLFAFFTFLFMSLMFSLNVILIPIGIISSFSGFIPSIIPIIRCPNSCKIAHIIIVMYIFIWLVIKNKNVIKKIFKSILNFIFISLFVIKFLISFVDLLFFLDILFQNVSVVLLNFL